MDQQQIIVLLLTTTAPAGGMITTAVPCDRVLLINPFLYCKWRQLRQIYYAIHDEGDSAGKKTRIPSVRENRVSNYSTILTLPTLFARTEVV